MPNKGPLVFHIVKHPHLPGVGLSKAGHWGNERFPDDASALAYARADAAGRPFTVERSTVTKRLLKVKP